MRLLLEDLEWPVCTRRLVIRPAIDADEEAIWSYRRLEATSMWLHTEHRDRAAFAARFQDPAQRANTLVIERNGAVIGNLLVRVEDAWSQTEVRDQAAGTQAEIGWVLHPGARRTRLRHRSRAGDLSGLLRPARPAPSGGGLLHRQHRLLAADGAGRDAPRAAHRARRVAPLR
jgi:hypothetical protein